MTWYRLQNGVQHYAWGDTRFIPDLLGIDNTDGAPFAELWMGDHPSLPSEVELDGGLVPLSSLLVEELPFLLKVLSAARPLSIQTHPDEEQARAGFAREQAAGIPLDASHRNYKDARAKPELLCALTDFYALVGFRADLPDELSGLGGDLEEIYRRVMTMPQNEVDARLEMLLAGLAGKDFEPYEREYWLLRCHEVYSETGHYDRGLFSIYLLNLIRLQPGEAVFLEAGTLHAYLQGSGMEIMASSNNVLRGGLTSKHVDIPELLSTVAFEPRTPPVLQAEPAGAGVWRYRSPAREFELRRLEGDQSSRPGHGPEILLVTDGETRVDGAALARGQSIFVPEGEPYELRGKATVYQGTVPW